MAGAVCLGPARAGARPSVPTMLAVTAVWGVCFVGIRWGLRDAPVLWFAALRSGVAGLALLAYGAAQRRRSPRTPQGWALVGALAVTNAGIASAAMFAGVAGRRPATPPPPVPSSEPGCGAPARPGAEG
jgi:probable blue pigment (indigoidine) exporter